MRSSTSRQQREAPHRTQQPGTEPREPPGVYIGSISVGGFRGVGPGATLTLRPGPGLTLVDDARAVALTERLPPDAASRVVPGFCRAAVEVACMERVRRRRLARGETHDDVEELLAANATEGEWRS